MFKKVISALSVCSALFISTTTTAATETVTYQQGVDNYQGATSTAFSGRRYQNADGESHFYRYDGTNRSYSLEHFALGNLNQRKIDAAKLVFYRVGGGFYSGSDIYVRLIMDPDNLGGDYATGWQLASGFRAGANKESRNDAAGVDVKWRSSDPDSPDDLNADYFQGVLKWQSSSPFFTPQMGDAVGTAYEVDVTDDLQCMQLQLCANQGWALYHSNVDANMQYITGNSRYPQVQYRPQLIVTYSDDLEPLIIKSSPSDETLTSIDGEISLSLTTDESATCYYDLSAFTDYSHMRYKMVSTDGINHSSQWPTSKLNIRQQLFGKCIDESNNISRTPHVFTFTVSADTATSGGGTGGGSTGGGTETPSEPYNGVDLLPGLNPTEVYKTLYATTDNDLVIELGDKLAADGSRFSYQVEGNGACKTSIVTNQCTFNSALVSTDLLTVSYSSTGTSGISGISGTRKIVVVTQPSNPNSTSAYTKNKVHIAPDYGLTVPVKGESRVDPITGVIIERLTDAGQIADSNDALIVYSRYSPENSTGDYLLVFGSNSTSSRVISRKTGELVTVLTDTSGATIGENHEVRWDTSGRHPNRVYFIKGMQFWMIDDITRAADSTVVVKDFTAQFPNATKIYNDVEGDSSNDSDHWAWMAVHYGQSDSGSSTYLVDAFIHYQVSTDTTHSLKPADLTGSNLDLEKDRTTFSYRPNMIEMSPLGTGVVLHMGRKWDDVAYGGKGVNYISSWFDGPHLWPVDFDFQTQAPVKISVDETHSGWSFDAMQREMFISQNNRTDRLDAIYVNGESSGYDHRVEVASHSDFGWGMGFHYGKMPQNKPGWLFMNSYSKDDSLWASNQFMMIQIKAEEQDPVIWRIAPAYNKYDGDYRDEAPAAINLSGNRIYWSSNWGGMLDHREVFMIQLPDNWDNEVLQ